ncbi:MAG: DUF58 domain-containing protein [Thermodesulfobacteriota bacterium]
MSPRLYKIYKKFWYIKGTFRARFTPSGRLILLFLITSAVFGINIQRTMIYQMFCPLAALLFLAWLFSLRFHTSVTIRRLLPETCTAGQELRYRLELSNNGSRSEQGLFFREELTNPLPSFAEFANTPEDGEEKRNWFDRRAGYYRWLWLIGKNRGAEPGHHPLPAVDSEGTSHMVEITPLRRGYIHFSGYRIFRHDPLGLLAASVPFQSRDNLLVLPKIYPLPSFLFHGSRKYQQGGIAAALKNGDSTEFMGLREYRHGDPVKHIDWKSSARTCQTVVREYQDEYFSRYGLVLDTFSPRSHSQVFEEAVSVAASIFMTGSTGDGILDLLFVGPESVISSSGPGIAEQQHMLEILASVATCRDKPFAELASLLKGHLGLLSGLAIIFIDMDRQRKELLDFLSSLKIPFTAMMVVDDREKGLKKLAAEKVTLPVTLLTVGEIERDLSTL